MTTEVVRREHSAEVANTILEAARDVLAEGGLDALSMRVVADRVGVTATALYHYFEGKQDLLNRVVESGFRRIGGYLEAAASAHPEGSIERILALGEAYIKFALENESYFRVLFSINAGDPKNIEDLPGGGGYHLVKSSVVAAMEAGNIRRHDPGLIAIYLWAQAHGLVTLALCCKLQGAEGCDGSQAVQSPVDLFHIFQAFVSEGLKPSTDIEGREGGN